MLVEPAHPYTRALTAVVPVPDPKAQRAKRGATARGEVPDPANRPSGCGFHTRCPEAMDVCRAVSPGWTALGDGGWRARCHLLSRDAAVPVDVTAHRATG